MTGSILPSRARAVRSTAYFSSAWKLDSGSWLVTRTEPRTVVSAARSASGVAPALRSRVAAGESTVAVAMSSMLGRGEVVLQLGRDVLRLLQDLQRGAGVRRRADRGAAGRRELLQLGVDGDANDGRRGAGRLEQRMDDAVGLPEQRVEQVQRLDLACGRPRPPPGSRC